MAQHFKDDIFLQKSVDNAPIIVEGQVVEQTTFMQDNNIFTKSKIKIHKKFKGDFKEPYFYLLHSGGEWNDIMQTCSHCFTLGSKAQGLFFLKLPTEGVDKGQTNTFAYLESGSTSFVYYMKDSLNLNTLAVSQDYTYTHIERGLLQKIEDHLGKKRQRLSFTEDEERLMKKLTSRGLHPTTPEDYDGLEYKLEQPTINFEQGQQFLSFDVFLKSYGLSQNYKMVESAIAFDYSGDLLPQNVIAQNIISIIKSQGFQSNDYQTQLLDVTNSKAFIGLEAPVTSLELHEISDVFEKMGKVKMNITNLNPLGTVRARFDENQMLNDNKFQEVNVAEPFDFVIAEDSLVGSVSEFLPIDFTFSPTTVTAGTFDGNDVITIEGVDLGTMTECSYPPITVTLRDAFDGGSRSTKILPYKNYLEWGVVAGSNPSRHYVKVRITGESADNPSGSTAYPGSGKIVVERLRDGQTGESLNPLTIRYCLRTGGISRPEQTSGCRSNPSFTYPTQQYVPVPIKMIDASNNNSGCYVIKFDNSFNNRAGAKAAFTRSLNRWRCLTGINFVINDNIDNQPGHTVLVSFGTTDNSSTLAITRTTNIVCNDNSLNDTRTVRDITMVFNSSHTWDFNNNKNFEGIALHELGHAHLLQHTNSQTDLMWWLYQQNDIGINDADASRFIVNRSTINSGGNCRLNMVSALALGVNCRTDNYEISEKRLVFSVYPNPTQSNFTIDIPDFDYKETQVTVVNSQGKVIHSEKRFTNQIQLQTDDWVKGLYCVTLRQGNKISTQKMMKQ